jgi:hypothetical protein
MPVDRLKRCAKNAGNRILGLQISKILWERMAPDHHSNIHPR